MPVNIIFKCCYSREREETESSGDEGLVADVDAQDMAVVAGVVAAGLPQDDFKGAARIQQQQRPRVNPELRALLARDRQPITLGIEEVTAFF